MQLTSPLFLFLFLPLSLALFYLTPRRLRAATLMLLSAAWLTLANLYNPWGLLHLFLVVALAATVALLPHRPKPLVPLTVAALLASLLSARILVALLPAYIYPTGLLFITLSAISLLLDTVRGDIRQKNRPVEVLCYLLFFPTATLGPAVRYKHFLHLLRKRAPSTARFCDGIRLFMLGYVKRIGMAAVLYRTISTVLGNAEVMPFIALPAVLLFALLLFYFFVSGCADMARGLAAMYGMRLPRDRKNLLFATAPHEMLGGLFYSVDRYIADYLTLPLCRRLGARWGKPLSAALTALCLLLLFAPVPAALLAGLILPITALITARRKPKARRPLLHALFYALSALACSPAALLVAADAPHRVLVLLRTVTDGTAARFYNFYFNVPDLQYILFTVTPLALLSLCLLLLYHNVTKLNERILFIIKATVTALAFAAFLLCLLYMTPQFPQYALTPFGKAW